MPQGPEVPYIAEGLRNLALPITSMRPHPENARLGDVGAISESLREFGQLRPIVVQQSTRFIVAVNHHHRAMQALGWEFVAALVVDLDDDAARAYMIADNRTQELGGYDNDALADLLSSLAESGNLAGTGYDGDDVDLLLADLARDQAPQHATGAGSFLDGFLVPQDGAGRAEPAIPSDDTPRADRPLTDQHSAPAALPSDGYVQLAFIATPDQRERVYRAIAAAKAAGSFDRQIDALAHICDEYTRTQG